MAQKLICAECGYDWKYGKCSNPDCKSNQTEWKEYDPEDPEKQVKKEANGRVIGL